MTLMTLFISLVNQFGKIKSGYSVALHKDGFGDPYIIIYKYSDIIAEIIKACSDKFCLISDELDVKELTASEILNQFA